MMVDAPGSTALARPGGPLSTFLSIDGERSRISSSDTSRGPAIDVSYVDCGHSRISSSGTSRGPVVDVSHIDGGRSRITSSGTSQEARRRCLLR
jgi:hypothetical protein